MTMAGSLKVLGYCLCLRLDPDPDLIRENSPIRERCPVRKIGLVRERYLVVACHPQKTWGAAGRKKSQHASQ